MEDKEKSFLDPRTILAIVLVGVVWFGWQSYLAKKYPNMNKTEVAATTATTAVAPATDPAKSEALAAPLPTAHLTESTEKVDSAEATFEVSSSGLGIRNLQLKKFTKRDHSAISFAPEMSEGLFSLTVLGQNAPLNFKVEQPAPNEFRGTANFGGTTIVRQVVYDPSTFSFLNEIELLHPDSNFPGFSIGLPEKREEVKKTGFLGMGGYEHQEFYVAHDDNKTERVNVSSAKDKVDQSFSGVSVAGVSSLYFASAIVDKSEVIPTAALLADPSTTNLHLGVQYKIPSPKDHLKFSFRAFAGPKNHEMLQNIDPKLTDIVDFGFFGKIGVLLLALLKVFNGVFNNWGVSIIVLTLLVRLLVLPVNITSYRSMKRMQKIQPQMAALRERYKEDPAQLQKETMGLMKREKVNPLGGCLPMLLQMPIFFALFAVLGRSIELYQAPFFGWLTDLSLKDPMYILPVLVGVVFFVQQKITPTTMDPAQAKIMQFMPILFSVMMIGLPSGLNLYTFVSTLFAVTQQRLFMRDRGAKPSGTTVVASAK